MKLKTLIPYSLDLSDCNKAFNILREKKGLIFKVDFFNDKQGGIIRMNEYGFFEAKQQARGIDVKAVRKRIKAFRVETPSWGYGSSGTRFKVFKDDNEARDIFEKIEYASIVNKFTGISGSVAIHIPWDKCGNYWELVSFAESKGIKIGAVNPNLFQDDDYKFGSLCNNNNSKRQKAIGHVKECIDIAKQTNSRDISLWLSDGTNYPGQADFKHRKHLLEDSLSQIYSYLPDSMRLLIEYKTFEPAFYHTDIADWGMSISFANKLGGNAMVLVDLGHHFQGVNIEHLVAFLLDEGKMGGFHFNNRKYADDDLIVGTVNPYELYLIFCELMAAEDDPESCKCAKEIAYMIDQSHNIEPKIPAMIRSVLNVQTAHAKSLLLDRASLKKAQRENDVLAAEAIVKGAFETDVKPLLESVRDEMGLQPDPMKAYLQTL